jgi:hypothetical protein
MLLTLKEVHSEGVTGEAEGIKPVEREELRWEKPYVLTCKIICCTSFRNKVGEASCFNLQDHMLHKFPKHGYIQNAGTSVQNG